MPDRIAPMLATPGELPADESEWAFEVKWDGLRAMAHTKPNRLRLLSRGGNDIVAGYPELRALGAALRGHSAVLDGEIVLLDEAGRPSFELLQTRMHVRGEAAVRQRALAMSASYMVFDLLWFDGHSLLALPYTERRRRLELLALEGGAWRTPEAFPGQGTALLRATREHRLEGIVGKRLDSPYLPGRHRAWIKVKNRARQDAVIGGFTAGHGARSGLIGSLLLGVHERDALRYIGAVGTGLTTRELEHLAGLLAPLERAHTPFRGLQPPRGSRFVEPKLICEVEFSDWTRAGLLRHPTYRGLADRREAAAITRVRLERASPGDPPAGESPDPPAHPGTPATGRTTEAVSVDGRRVRLTNLEKVLYPETGFTKRQLIGYYTAVAPVLLPHLRDRPLTLRRYPDGVGAERFYEKRSPTHRPEWVQTATVAGGGRGEIRYTLCQDLATLTWLANLASVELHPLLATARDPTCPTAVVFDLDPGDGAGLRDCCAVALSLRDLLARLQLDACVKTSGSKGLHVMVPLNRTEVHHRQARGFARAVAGLLEEHHPELIVSSMARSRRLGRVLIDWNQNDAHRTTAGVYSLRATAAPRVSTPLAWKEVMDGRDGPRLPSFGPEEVLSRIAAHGDLFAKMLSLQQTLPTLED